MNKENREEKKSKAEDYAEGIKSVGIQKTRWQRYFQFTDTRAIVFITLIYTVFAGLQWCSIRESNRINQEALLSVQRAHVNFKTIESTGIRDAQGRITAWHFFPQWENSGATPTKIMRQHYSAKWPQTTLPNDFDFHDSGPNDNRTILLAPKAITSTGPLIIRPDVIAGVKERKLHLFFWG